MAEKETREISTKEKQQVTRPQEQTRPVRSYVPEVNIYEFGDSLKFGEDMPGVKEKGKDNTSLLSAIVDSCDDAIVSKTLEGIITSWNLAAERMFGYSAKEAVGQSIRMIIPPERQTEEDFILGRIRSGEKVDHFETIRLTKDGRRLDISLTVSPVRDSDGTIVGASKVARDITSKKQTEHELETTRQRLSQALAIRDKFFAVASHELRNPLNVLWMLWSSDEKCEDPARHRRIIEKSKRQLERLVAIMDRMLDVARIRSGVFSLDRQRVNLTKLLQEIVERFTQDDPQSTVSLRCDTNIEGHWDRLLLDEVVTNLVSNALKYGAQKPVAVSGSQDGDIALITVEDDGIGISPEHRESIFEPFERAGLTPGKEGLGIGLWITKQIVDAHGGSIEVKSEVGQGSTFVVRLPVNSETLQ
jgi:PAS domain S-box-containing protein